MIGGCAVTSPDIGVIRSVLAAADCNVTSFAEVGYKALTGPQSIFPLALTAMLSIYIALLGYRLMFGQGGARLTDAPLIALKVGAILAVTLNWNTFQTLVFNVTTRGPIEIGQIVTGHQADPLDRLQAAYDKLLAAESAFTRLAGATEGSSGAEAATAQSLLRAAAALFWSTAGILAFANIATGILTVVGPVFIALFLFEETQGLFLGWVKALVAVALVPMISWITIVVMLMTLEPWLNLLMEQIDSARPSVGTATIVTALVFVFAAAQVVLLIANAIIASGLRLAGHRRRSDPADETLARDTREPASEPQSRAQMLAQTLQRQSQIDATGTRSPAAIGAATDSRARPVGRGEVSARAVRIGESYRRRGAAQSASLRRERP